MRLQSSLCRILFHILAPSCPCRLLKNANKLIKKLQSITSDEVKCELEPKETDKTTDLSADDIVSLLEKGKKAQVHILYTKLVPLAERKFPDFWMDHMGSGVNTVLFRPCQSNYASGGARKSTILPRNIETGRAGSAPPRSTAPHQLSHPLRWPRLPFSSNPVCPHPTHRCTYPPSRAAASRRPRSRS